MRITESRLRQIVREELATADYKREASLETPSAESRATILGDRNMRIRDLEGEIKSAVLKAWETWGSTENYGVQKYRWYASTTPTPPDIELGTNQRIVSPVIPGRLWFVLECPELSLAPEQIKRLEEELAKIWQVPAGDTMSNNVVRLSSVKGDIFDLTIDFPAIAEKPAANLAGSITVIKRQADTLSQILLKFYGLPLSRANYPIYKLFAREYTTPKSDPDKIPNGALIKLPLTVRSPDGSMMTRKK